MFTATLFKAIHKLAENLRKLGSVYFVYDKIVDWCFYFFVHCALFSLSRFTAKRLESAVHVDKYHLICTLYRAQPLHKVGIVIRAVELDEFVFFVLNIFLYRICLSCSRCACEDYVFLAGGFDTMTYVLCNFVWVIGFYLRLLDWGLGWECRCRLTYEIWDNIINF